jgi:hypothetical protein
MVRFVEQCSLCCWIDGRALDGWAEAAIKESASKMAQRIAIATETEPFKFVQQHGQVLTLREILFQAMGAASVCWSERSLMDAGEFDSTRAKRIAEALQAEVDRALRHAGAETSKAWSDLAYEFYALACNSQPYDLRDQRDWQAAFERLKARFHELLPDLTEEPRDDQVSSPAK